jgi:hypothetical protein
MEKFNMASNRVSSSSSKKIDLALQGGGAHGAFTWGVLDRLLDEKSVEICGLSGTSAGAMNAAIMASGYAIGGRSGAQKALEDYWKTISDAAKFSPFQRSFLDRLMGHWTLDYSPTYAFADALGRVLSPYDMPTGGINPLKDVLDKAIDFKALNLSTKPWKVKGLAIIDVKNKKWSELEGLAVLSGIEVQNDTNIYLLDNLSLISRADGLGRKRVEIQSEIVEADIQGNFDIEKIPNAVKNLFFDVLSCFFYMSSRLSYIVSLPHVERLTEIIKQQFA